LTGRRNCVQCGAICNVHFSLSCQKGICDKCGGNQLVQRDDDTEPVVRRRFSVYRENTEALIRYYQKKGFFQVVNANGDIASIFEKIKEAIQ